jgi:hypothetical protein
MRWGKHIFSKQLGIPPWGLRVLSPDFEIDWLRVIRLLTHYVAPGLAAGAVITEITGWLFGAPPSLSVPYNYILLIVFSLLTASMIGICGWIVCLWDLDRLFIKLDTQMDSHITALELKSGESGNDNTLFGRAKDVLLNKIMMGRRDMSVRAIEKAYWLEINAGGALAFPKPDIAAAVDQIEKSRRDLLAPLTEVISGVVPLGTVSAPIVSRLIFKYLAPEVKVRLYRRLLLRFLSQLGALFILTAICFYISILGWSRVSKSVFFSQSTVSPISIALYQLDLMLRGALFDFMEHTRQSISPISINRKAAAFVYYTLIFRMFVATYVISSLLKVLRFVLRRWKVLLRLRRQ